MRCWHLLLLFCTVRPAAGQLPEGARVNALGGAATALVDDFWGANPAAWSATERPAAGLYGVQLYGMQELRLASSLVVAPFLGGSFATGAATFGYNLYRKSRLSLGYARGIRPGTFRPMYVGLRLAWHVVRVDGYGRASTPAVTAGLLLPVSSTVTFGAAAVNVMMPAGPLRDELPRALAVGFSWTYPTRVLITADIYKDLRAPAAVRVGVEVTPVGAIALRIGAATNPSRAAAGMGLRFMHLLVDICAQRHDALGWSPAFAVQFVW